MSLGCISDFWAAQKNYIRGPSEQLNSFCIAIAEPNSFRLQAGAF